MGFNIELDIQDEDSLKRRAAEAGLPVEEFARLLLIRDVRTRNIPATAPDSPFFMPKVVPLPSAVGKPKTVKEYMALLDSLVVTSLPPGHFVDDSRESIYEGCGE